MSRAITARGRAARFHDAVEGAPTGAADERLADLLSLVTALRSAEQVTPRAEFSADLRSQLMLAARTELAPVEAPEPERRTNAPRSKRERRIAVAIGGFAVVSATTSMAVAAQSALPGDTLYPLKRAIENAHVSVQSSPEDKGGTLLRNASGRLEEVGELTSTGKAPAADVAHTLDDFADQASAASDLLISDYQNTGDVASLEELSDFTSHALSELKLLQDVVPVAARGALIKAAQVLNQIDQLAAQACPSCALTSITEVPLSIAANITSPLSDLLGVLPAADEQAEKPKKHQGQQQAGEQKPAGDSPRGEDTQPGGKKTQKPPAKTSDKQSDGDEEGLVTGIINGLTDTLTGSRDTGSGSGDGGDQSGQNGGKGLLDGGLGGVLESGVGAIDGLLGLHD